MTAGDKNPPDSSFRPVASTLEEALQQAASRGWYQSLTYNPADGLFIYRASTGDLAIVGMGRTPLPAVQQALASAPQRLATS